MQIARLSAPRTSALPTPIPGKLPAAIASNMSRVAPMEILVGASELDGLVPYVDCSPNFGDR